MPPALGLAGIKPVPSQSTAKLGKVYLVGAGPGDPGLITVRGSQCLAAAQLVLYDYLVNPQLLKYVPKAAKRICLGRPHGGRSMPQEEINQQMIAAAKAGLTVVRLKSGDPHLFGRGAEEVAVLTEAGIPFAVIPGVTAAFAAASHANIPITHRDLASAVAMITGHQREDGPAPEMDYGALAHFPGTLIFYMGMTTARHWSEALLQGGKAPDTPVAIVRRASWPDQETLFCTLATVADRIDEDKIRPPAVIIVGQAARRQGQRTKSQGQKTKSQGRRTKGKG